MRYVIPEGFLLVRDSAITDDHGQPAYHVQRKVLTLHTTLIITDMQGTELARVEQQPDELVTALTIKREGEAVAEVRKKLLDPVIHYTIDFADAKVQVMGNVHEHAYDMMRGEETVATITKQWIRLINVHGENLYGVDIAEGENDLMILCGVLALDLAVEWDRHHP